MPPRLPISCRLGSLARVQQPEVIRFFSATTAVSAPRDDHHHRTPSSTSSLLSLNRTNNRRQPPSGNNGAGSGSGMNFKLPQQQQQRPEKQHRASDAASQLMKRYGGRAAITASNRQATVDQIREQKVSNEYLREMPRRWQVGDVYSPHDLSPVEMNKWRRRSQRKGDVIDALGIRPLDTYKNFSIISDFTNASGQIVHSDTTGLRPVNQRKVAKMIRRAQGMGIYPSIHGHPELIREQFYPLGYSPIN